MEDFEVLEYRMVTASGEIMSVSKDDIYVIDDEGNAMKLSDDDPKKKSDIFFGLKGAGGSFGIITGRRQSSKI